ncbi:F-box protein SKIP5-like [Lathyrus oleraceus]|uniref:F-box protein SKIP5-like n=1 Tax=Pisum sativum TaxID=3888 RepID=UPI0021D3BF24|nr:F-box protein SKIP5-like [Pisum sativum]
MTNATRGLEREVASLQLVAEIKRTAKTGNEAATKTLARQLIRLRQQIGNLQGSQAQMRGIATHTQAMHAHSSVVVGIQGTTKAMAAMNKRMEPAKCKNSKSNFVTARNIFNSPACITALVCHRWNYLACHPRLWLRVDQSVKDLSEPGVSPNIETAVSASRPGDTILIAAVGTHRVANIQINKPLCLIGAVEIPDDTMLTCSRGSDSALEFLSTCKLSNLTVKAELGCCLLHRSGRLIIDGCLLQCESNPLDFLSCPIVSTACSSEVFPSQTKCTNGLAN